MYDHADRDREQQHGRDPRVVQNLGRGDGVHGEGGEVDRRPSASDQSVGEGAIGSAPLNGNARDQHGERAGITERNASDWPDMRVRIVEEQRHPDYDYEDADLVEPASAEQCFPLLTAPLWGRPPGLPLPRGIRWLQ